METDPHCPALATVDPGVRGCGVAIWYGGALFGAVYVRSVEAHATRAGGAVPMADAVASAVAGHVFGVAVVEWPVQRAGAGSVADRRDISDLTAVAAVIAADFARARARVVTPLPEEWKGQVPKHIHGARIVGGAIAAARLPLPKGYTSGAPGQLSPAELEAVQWTTRKEWNHNIVDAVGIGLRYLRRAN